MRSLMEIEWVSYGQIVTFASTKPEQQQQPNEGQLEE
jgi:hypothetical protein